jgi:putative endonuclease
MYWKPIGNNMSAWFVYVVRCSDGSLYTGITNNIKKRILEHNYGTRGAKYTKSRRPVRLLYKRECDSRSHALKEEWAFKKLKKTEKERIIKEDI